MVSKIFILNFITSYLPIILTAFVYVPFAQIIVPYLDVFQLAVRPFAENEKQMSAPKVGFQINPERLKKQVIYFTFTAQLVSFALEVVVPFATRKVFHKVKEVRSDRAAKRGAGASINDHPEEAAFLDRVRDEAELAAYDVTIDFREMIVQFGTWLSISLDIANQIRIPIFVLRRLAPHRLLLFCQQLDRAPRRCHQDRPRLSTPCTMER